MQQVIERLETIWHSEIPISRAMGIRATGYDGSVLRARAGLAENVNVHGTAFAGSLYAIAALCGWGMTWLQLEERSLRGSIVIAEGHITYTRPVTGDIEVCCRFDPQEQAEALERLAATGKCRFALTVEDPDGASDTDAVDIDVTIDVDLDDTQYDVDEDDTVAVEITLGEEAPQDVEVELSVDDDVVVFVPNSNDDESDEITSVTIDAGEDSETVYLYGLEDGDDDDESTDIEVSVGTDDCGARDTASVDVEDDDKNVETFIPTRSLQLFVLRMQLFTII